MPAQPATCDCGSPLRVFTQAECLSCGRLSLYDVKSVDAFVADAIKDGHARLSLQQREEMMAEGRQIMLRLAMQYQPGKGGRDVTGSRFSGFAAKYLRLKLSDAYARVVERDEADGEPALRPAISLDQIEDRAAQNGSAFDGYAEGWEAEIDQSASLEKQYMRLVMQGYSEREAGQLMRLPAEDVHMLTAILKLRLEG